MTRQYIQNLLQREFFSIESLVGMFAVRPVSGFPVCKYRQDMADQHIVRRNQPFQFRFGQLHQLLSSGKSSLPSIPSSSGW